MERFLRRFAGFLALCCLLAALPAEEVWNADEGWGLNLPEGWVLMDASSGAGNFNFSDPAGHAILQVFRVEGSARAYAAGLQASMKVKPVAGSPKTFLFNKCPGQWTEATWQVGQFAVHGVILAIDVAGSDASGAAASVPAAPQVLVAYALDAEWTAYKDQVLSLLDSFFIGEDAACLPGPVSQMDANDGWSGGPLPDLAAATRVSRAVAQRESRILATFQDAGPEIQGKAWRRFYQMLWKDSYSRLDDVANQISRVFSEEKVTRERMPRELLAFVQDFKAETYDTLEDIRVPLDAINTQAGDCDGRGLVYMILLEHMGFSSILLVSSVYQHSMVGLDYQAAGIKGGGFTYPLDGKAWMVAETMAKVPLGQINRDMSDVKNWLGFDLHFIP